VSEGPYPWAPWQYNFKANLIYQIAKSLFSSIPFGYTSVFSRSLFFFENLFDDNTTLEEMKKDDNCVVVIVPDR